MEKFVENLKEAQRIVQTVDYMLDVPAPLINDKRFLLKILVELKVAVVKCVNCILQYEYFCNRINLSMDAKVNLRIFEKKCAVLYGISQNEIKLIFELFNLVRKHKNSACEFVRNGKIVILSEDSSLEFFTFEETKKFLQVSKNLLIKIQKTVKIND